MMHFTPVDINWPVELPPDLYDPQQPTPNFLPVANPSCLAGSIIECENQTLRESISVAGTPFSLSYSSARVPGRKATVDISLSGATVPVGLQGIELRIYVAGREFIKNFTAAPNQRYTFL